MKEAEKATGPIMGRRGFLATIATTLGLGAIGTLFTHELKQDRDGGNRGRTSDVTARYWTGGDKLAG